MNTITLHMENRADNTAVSNYFIDTLMPQANGEFVKIYLYLLRCVSAGHISLSVSDVYKRQAVFCGLHRFLLKQWKDWFPAVSHRYR